MSVINTPKTVSIDFNSNEIKVVEGKVSKKGIQINKYCSISIPIDLYHDGIIEDIEQLSYLIRTGLTENNISMENAFAVINSSRIILREVLFPKVDVKDIDNLIKYQLGDYIPIHPEDYVVKYIILGTVLDNGVEKLNLLLIGIPIGMVENHLSLLKNIGLKPQVLDYKGNSICKLLSYNDSINSQLYTDKTIAFIDINFENTGLSILKNEYIKVSRIVEQNFYDFFNMYKNNFNFTDGEIIENLQSIDNLNMSISTRNDDYDFREGIKENFQDLMDKVEMIFRYYRTREIGNNIDLILIHGDMTKVEGVEKLFSSFFNIPSFKLKSLNKLKFEGDLSLYANAIGGLIRLNGVKA